jgi:hypothetical protein
VAENGGSAQNFLMEIKLLQRGHFTRTDAKYGADVKRKLGLQAQPLCWDFFCKEFPA